MISPAHIMAAQQVAKAGADGSPLLLGAVGRLCGLGAAEQRALGRGGVPGWLWGVLGVGGGVMLGAVLYRRYPSQMDAVMPGGRGV